MKKPSAAAPAPASASRLVLVLVAVGSLALNGVLAAFLALGGKGEKTEPAATPSPAAAAPWSRELAPYAQLGSFMAEHNRIADLKWTAEQFAAFQEGFRASYEGRGLPLEEAGTKLRDGISARVQAMLEAERPDPVREYFRFLREKENVTQAPSGLHYRVTEEGSGDTPKPGDVVVMSYSAGLPEGKSLPALSRSRAKVAVRDLLPGLAEGVQLLRVGGKGLIYLPPSLSFTPADWPPQLPANTPLVFFVELHDIQAGNE